MEDRPGCAELGDAELFVLIFCNAVACRSLEQKGALHLGRGIGI